MNPRTPRFVCFLASLAFPALVVAHTFPPPFNSEPDTTAEPPSPEESLASLQLPKGFSANLFAAEPDVQNPIAMAWDWRGRMWVAENYTYAERAKRFELSLRDRVLIFEDSDGDGKADSRTVFSDDLQFLTSVEVGRGGVWLMCPPQLLFVPDANEDDVPDGDPIVVLDGFTVAQSNYHNFANGLRWGPDGWLYGRCGHSCPGKLGIPGTPEKKRIPIKGGIWRFHPERKVVEVLTHGTTNPWGHDWDEHGELFFINTVNGHLWHGIHGAHFKESFGQDPNPKIYERLDMHADHWHYDTTGKWSESRGGKANDFGGGHAHIGMMIYQGDSWPERFHGRLMTLNMHGLRTNVERLERHGSGYLARHEKDVFLMGDPWFRGIDIQQGPDGSAYVLDWSDTGECHEHTGVHRTSGRIYRIQYGEVKTPGLSDLAMLRETTKAGINEQALAAMQRIINHPNPWFERQLRSLLVSARVSGQDVGGFADALRNIPKIDQPHHQLRTFWTLHALGETSPPLLHSLLQEANEHLRTWGIRLLTDSRTIDTTIGPQPNAMPSPMEPAVFRSFLELAKTDESGLVRLALASALQRLPLKQRAELGTALAARAEDADDHNLPSMVWYGVSPMADSDPSALVELAATSSWPTLLTWLTRSLSESIEKDGMPLDTLLSQSRDRTPEIQAAILQGISDGLQGMRKATKPASWETFANSIDPKHPPLAQLTQELSVLFGSGRALDAIKKVALDPKVDLAMRKAALQTLIDNRPPDLREICESLLNQRIINTVAVGGLAIYDDPKIGETLAKNYRRFYPAERSAVISTLVSRPTWASALLAQIKAGRIAKSDLTAFQARQIRSFQNEELTKELESVWGRLRDSSEEKRQQIAEWKSRLTPEVLSTSDLGQGRVLYQAVCGACHIMYGEGGKIGPDLTGSGRADLDYLVENIFDPSAVVSADYQMSILTLADGRVLTGVITTENERTLTLRQAIEETVLEVGQIAHRENSPVSMMPEGLLLAFGPEQVRDLIAYLQHPLQVPLPETP
ncbi:MAG: PVC-type heme-binding CxxCH protein [Verrucomicrobiota bacterium]